MEIGKSGIRLEYFGYSGFVLIGKSGRRIAIDPYKLSDSGNGEGVDIILITHSHIESCSIEDIKKLIKKDKKTTIICTPDVQSKVMKIENINVEVVESGDLLEMSGGNIKIEVMPAYNKNKDYHTKSEGWVGYLIKLGGVVVYHAGDTDFIPEMKKLSGYGKHGEEFVALLPVGGKTVMNEDSACEAASMISPGLTIPMHYDYNKKSEMEKVHHFVELCKEKNIKAVILDRV